MKVPQCFVDNTQPTFLDKRDELVSGVVTVSCIKLTTIYQPGIERGQALDDISRSALYAFAVCKAISLHMCMLS